MNKEIRKEETLNIIECLSIQKPNHRYVFLIDVPRVAETDMLI